MICKEARRFLLSLKPQNGETEKQKKKKGHEQMDYNTPHATGRAQLESKFLSAITNSKKKENDYRHTASILTDLSLWISKKFPL